MPRGLPPALYWSLWCLSVCVAYLPAKWYAVLSTAGVGYLTVAVWSLPFVSVCAATACMLAVCERHAGLAAAAVVAWLLTLLTASLIVNVAPAPGALVTAVCLLAGGCAAAACEALRKKIAAPRARDEIELAGSSVSV